MPATITSEFRKNNAKKLIDQSVTALWIGIGKSDPWPSTDTLIDQPNSSLGYSANVLNNLITLQKCTVQSLVIPDNAWMSGRIYKVYSASDDSCFIATLTGTAQYPCYITNSGYVYLCTARSSETASVVAPTHTSGSVSLGVYTWAYLYTLDSTKDTTAFKVVPTALLSSAVVGLTDLTKILPCWFAMFYSKFDTNTSNADIPASNDYRQICLVDNPTRVADAGDTTASSLDCLKYLTVINNTATSVLGDAIISQCDSNGIVSGAIAYAHRVDGGTKVYYHQNTNSNVNLTAFTATGHFKISGGSPIAYSASNAAEYTHGTGNVLFIENRAAIVRQNNQSEEIKLIVQL